MTGLSIGIGDWTLDLDSQRLSRDGVEHRLAPKEFAVLHQLAEVAPNALTIDALLQRGWPDLVVGDNAVHQVIRRLRTALGDDARCARYIETVPRRGYRLSASVSRRGDTDQSAAHGLVKAARRLPGGHPRDNPIGIALLEQAVEIDPECADAWAWLSWRHSYAIAIGSRDAKPLAHAEACAKRGLEIDPQNGWARYALGQVRVVMGQFGLAIGEYRSAAALEPSGDFILLDLCHLLTLNGQLEEALATGLRGFCARPEPNSCFHLAFPLRLLAHARARALLELAITQPNDPDGRVRCRTMLANLDVLDGHTNKAHAFALKIGRNGVAWDECTLAAADILQFVGDWPAARKCLEPLMRVGYSERRSSSLTRRSAPTAYALTLRHLGESTEASTILCERASSLTSAVEDGCDNAAVFTEMATIAVANCELAGGLAWLERAYDAGYRDAEVLRLDPTFAPLRGESRFGALLGLMQRDLARMSANAERQGMLREVDAIGETLRSSRASAS